MIAYRPLYALLALAACATAEAHRLDEYLQSTTFRIDAGRVSAHLRLVPGVDVAPQVWNAIDTDGDGTISAAEQQAYTIQVVNDLLLEIDGREVELHVVHVAFPTRADVMRGFAQVTLDLDAAVPRFAGSHRLHFVSRHRPVASVYLANTLLPAQDTVRITNQHRSTDQSVYDVDFTAL